MDRAPRAPLVDVTTDSLEEWQRLIASHLLTLHMIPDGAPGFDGRIRSRRFGDITLAVLDAGPHLLRRSGGRAAQGEVPYLNISLQRHGTSTISQHGRHAELHPGDFVLYDTSAPYTRDFPGRYGSFVLMLPRARVGLPLEAIRAITARKVTADSGLGAAVGRFLADIGERLDAVHDDAGVRVSQAIIDLVAATIIDALGVEMTEKEFRRRRLRFLVHEYIDQHFADPLCTSSTIADAFHISRRHLHAVFADEPATVAELLRERRLEEARIALQDPGRRWCSIAAIAHAHGFASAAAFTRAFQSAFGVTPKAVRPAVASNFTEKQKAVPSVSTTGS